MQKKSLAPLTSLRFFAAIFVIFFHNPGVFYHLFVERLGFYTGFLVVHHGYAAVAFFFILSGFILAYNYHSHQFTHKYEVFRFYAARIARLYPAYICSIIVSFLFLITYVHQNAYSRFEWIKAVTVFPLSLVMLQSWVPFWLDSFANINPPSWSLSIELFLYLLFPSLLLLVRNLKTSHLLFLLPILALIGMVPALFFEWKYFGKVILMSSLQTLEIPGGGTSWMSLTNTLSVVYIPQFLIGVVGGICFVRYNAILTIAAKWLIWPVILFILWVYASDHFSSRAMQTGLMAIPYLLLILFGGSDIGIFSAILSHPLLVRLGEISYCVYIFAFPIEYYFTAFIEHMLHMKMNLVLFAVYFAALLIFCNWFYSYQEKWREKIIKKFNNLLIVSNCC